MRPQSFTWFKSKNEEGIGPQTQMFEDARSKGHAVYIARDGYKGNKEYASCATHEELAAHLLLMEQQEQVM